MDQNASAASPIGPKNASVIYKGVKINIVDYAGTCHSAVKSERTLRMVDGVLDSRRREKRPHAADHVCLVEGAGPRTPRRHQPSTRSTAETPSS